MSFKNGSICLDKLWNATKPGHPSITVGKDGKKYLAITIWENDQPDKFGNIGSIQIACKKGEEKIYIGNTRNPATPAPTSEGKEPIKVNDDAPF